MAFIVQKFGGTSVGSAEKINLVAKRVVADKKKNNRIVVIVSAMGGTTDGLMNLAHQITKKPSSREMDMLLSTGEQVSTALLAMAIHKQGEEAISFTGQQVGITTDNIHQKAKIISINGDRIQKELAKNKIVIVAGFQGIDENQDITTLGRGGSDTTAVAIAAALKADLCEIYTDVDGIYTADPRVIPNAKKLSYVTYDEILELSSLGAQVLHSRSVEIAKKYNIPLSVRSTFLKDKGTLLLSEKRYRKENKNMEKILVSGVACDKKEAKVSIVDIPDRPGIAAHIFGELADGNIVVDMIIQSAGEDGKNDISFTVLKDDLKKTLGIMRKIAKKLKAKDVIYDKNIAKVSAIGIGMRSHSGVAARMFRILGKTGINIQMISTSEIKISCVVKQNDADRALQVIHKEFNLDK
ncbi:MAG: aspartate kinase [bacterium]